jgi:predicted nucleotidyltransferase
MRSRLIHHNQARYNNSVMTRSPVVDEELLETISTRIAEAIRSQKIILFGSWARGERDAHSDIDLLIIHESDLPRPQRYAQVRRLFWGMGIPIDILAYTPEEFERYQAVPGSFTHTVAHEGKVLYARPSE